MRSERRLHWTTRDYFDLESHSSEKHEFLDGEIFAMEALAAATTLWR